jgi:NADPH oxidase
VNLQRVDLIWVCRNINQLQWFANLLVTLSTEFGGFDSKFFRVQLFLTRANAKDQVPEELRQATTFGRPDWDAMLKKARQDLEGREYAQDVKRVGVFLCGGHTLGKQLAKVCRRYSDRKYKFQFKKEHF